MLDVLILGSNEMESKKIGEMKKNKIFLTGFMGCGKSTFGKKLAKELSWDFIDLDDYIEKQEGMSIVEIFKQKGETYFRQLESDAVAVSMAWNNAVVSTGGGTPCFNNNMEMVNQLGVSVFINLSPEVLAQRLELEKNKRPLLKDLDHNELLIFIKNKLTERKPFYAKSQLVFNYESESEKGFIDRIKEII